MPLQYSGTRFPKRSPFLLSKNGRCQRALIGCMSLNERVAYWDINPGTTCKNLSPEFIPSPLLPLCSRGGNASHRIKILALQARNRSLLRTDSCQGRCAPFHQPRFTKVAGEPNSSSKSTGANST